MQDSYHASIAEYKMELVLQHILISLEMAKVEDLKPMIIGLRPCALAATRNSIKERNSTNPNGLRCGRTHIAPPLPNFLNGDLLMQNEPMTLQQISDIEGVSKQRVAEILENALRKMRIVLEKRGIKSEDLL